MYMCIYSVCLFFVFCLSDRYLRVCLMPPPTGRPGDEPGRPAPPPPCDGGGQRHYFRIVAFKEIATGLFSTTTEVGINPWEDATTNAFPVDERTGSWRGISTTRIFWPSRFTSLACMAILHSEGLGCTIALVSLRHFNRRDSERSHSQPDLLLACPM